jgi:predicted dehydrogenase
MRWKIALVGLGAAARSIHLPACARLPEVEVVGGCDPAAQPGDFPFPLFRSPEEMLERTRPDVLAVVTPPESHHALARLGLLAGCHVFCEKPFTSDLAEAADLVELSRRLGRWVVVNNQYRFMNVHRGARKQIGRPEFGELLFLDASQTFFVTDRTEAGWRGRDPRRTCKEFGTHVLDLCRFFFGEDPLSVTARMPRGQAGGGPDYLNLIQVEFSGDRVAHVTLDRLCRGPHRYLNLRLDGSRGCIETSLGGRAELAVGLRPGSWRPSARLDLWPGGAARLYHGERWTTIARDPLGVMAHATRRLLRAFLRAVSTGSEPPCHADDNRRTLALMLAAYESAERRAPVPMRY